MNKLNECQDLVNQILSYLEIFPDLVSSRYVCTCWKMLIDVTLGIIQHSDIKPTQYKQLNVVPFMRYNEEYRLAHPQLRESYFSHTIYQMRDPLAHKNTPFKKLIFAHGPAIKTLTIPQLMYNPSFFRILANACPNLERLIVASNNSFNDKCFSQIKNQKFSVISASSCGMMGRPSYVRAICFENCRKRHVIENDELCDSYNADLTAIAKAVLEQHFKTNRGIGANNTIMKQLIIDYSILTPLLGVVIESGCQSCGVYKAFYENACKTSSQQEAKQLFADIFNEKLDSNFYLTNNSEFSSVLSSFHVLKLCGFINQNQTSTRLFYELDKPMPNSLRAERINRMHLNGIAFPSIEFLSNITDDNTLQLLAECLLYKNSTILVRNDMEIFVLISAMILDGRLPQSFVKELFLHKKYVMERLEEDHLEMFNFFYEFSHASDM